MKDCGVIIKLIINILKASSKSAIMLINIFSKKTRLYNRQKVLNILKL